MAMRTLKILLFVFFVLAFLACAKEEKKGYTPPENTIALLTNDSSKVWKLARRYNGKTRMNMEGCFMKYRQVFYANMTVEDNNALNANCGPSLKGGWSLLKKENGLTYIRIQSEDIPELLNQKDDFKDFKILHVNQDSLAISFYHNQFGSKKRITDYLVREDFKVSDRNFHY